MSDFIPKAGAQELPAEAALQVILMLTEGEGSDELFNTVHPDKLDALGTFDDPVATFGKIYGMPAVLIVDRTGHQQPVICAWGGVYDGWHVYAM